MKKSIFMFILVLLILNLVYGLDIDKQNKLTYGHVLLIEDFQTVPTEVEPGTPSQIKMIIHNSGLYTLNDVRVKLELTTDVSFYNDVSQKKISKLLADERKELVFNIISNPDSSEGIKKAYLLIDYIDQAGDESQENYSVSLIIKSRPNLFVEVEESEIYKKNPLGDITLTFYNNNLGNIKFLTVELDKSSDYQIISNSKKYIGDLDSDDFQSTSFRLKVNDEKDKIVLPVKITYRDSLNKEYKDTINAELYLRNAKDLGIKTRNSLLISAGILFAILIIIYYFYRKNKKKKGKREDY